ncbi:hypothetical protein RhiirA1_470457 [Rhizophagus irregularis]|uniref:Replication origin-binding protein domain-containing protein n=1 Tax=Rhizophagus irregularis TaxID=588596 RepID=A0A2N0R645_9GLOM|nr:hypothetical protein RhiirA1_470457 [Rhizophagus irregularis]
MSTINEPGEVFEYDPSIAEKIQQENKNSPQSSHKVKYSETLMATETYNEKYVRPLPNEDDIYVGSPWETGKTYILENLAIPNDVNLLVLSTRYSYSNAVTTRLNLKSYCDIDGNINLPDYKKVVCQIESLHRITNNCKCNKKCKCLLIHYDLWLDEIVCEAHYLMDNDLTDLNIEWIKALRKDRVFSIIHNTYQPQEEERLFRWLLNAKCECLLQELQNRGIFLDIVSIIQNKEVPTIRLWVAYMLEKFQSHHLFGWRMTVKVNSSIIKAEEISDISNAHILDHEIAKVLENKPKKTLEEMRSLDWHHIFRTYRQLRNTDINNEHW